MKATLKWIICAAWLAAAPAWAKVQTVTDVLGRQVKVDVPAKRVVLGFYYPDYIAATGAENFKHVVGISREFWEKFNPGSWALYSAKMPALKQIGDIGNIDKGSFSFEKTIALKPDVLILADWQFKALADYIPRFEQAGIPVVVVDFNAQTVERHTESAKIFGQIAGTPERAKQAADEYAAGIEDIRRRVAAAKLLPPKIYIEFGDKGPSEHSYTFGKNMWGAIADTVGGDNVSKLFVDDWGAINPEQLLASPPDVVLISGTEVGANHPDAMTMGIGITADEAQKRLAGFTRRSGWQDFPAVKNRRVYGIYHTASRSLSDLASAQLMAKALYPAAFADVDPEQTYRDFHRKYLPVMPEGTFFIRLGCGAQADCTLPSDHAPAAAASGNPLAAWFKRLWAWLSSRF
ncbi:ABC transporter substrate-binding protein [Neisseria chenwenguii]|uniref:Iron ABC transporter substrate-binding protein n=1 Tax=Neisseria chenwenguii TaxID=1853278 RepID=A0A220S0A4_9NEIS|nr:ABC transporter substrate-binding protein [Neisseria chenwenguii]ASK26818.1 iron ABC transporter substrate-binding protein [Neisseria chenwenguii]ROV56796.1 iron ABC transporter substrate-binding protein [Neisseria chenwenguii]